MNFWAFWAKRLIDNGISIELLNLNFLLYVDFKKTRNGISTERYSLKVFDAKRKWNEKWKIRATGKTDSKYYLDVDNLRKHAKMGA